MAGQLSDNVSRVEPTGTVAEIIDRYGDLMGDSLEDPSSVGINAPSTGTSMVSSSRIVRMMTGTPSPERSSGAIATRLKVLVYRSSQLDAVVAPESNVLENQRR